MIEIESISDLELLRESVDLECKLAAGRDGQGVVPDDFWPTYSAFANTEGGLVVLGLRDKQRQFSVEGVANVARVRKELFDTLNNREKVSVNLVNDAAVREISLNGKTVLVIEIPRATRKQRPVYLTTNPFAGHTYRRLNDGDRPLPDDEVKRMLAEQVEDSRDDRILLGFGFDDLSLDTFRSYRQVFANRDPNHPWNTLEDREFLRQIGGWRQDRETREGGLTLAGLLMFSQMATIQEELPNYMLDYQEKPKPKTEGRWIDRLTLDGNGLETSMTFYRKVYLKLTADLKVPFRLERGERKDETPVHEALREALANVIVHADYSDRASVLVVKRPDMFGFRNPGLMRIPTKLYDTPEPYNQTLLELRMIDLFPEQIMVGLKSKFGTRFEGLSHVERVALALAASEGTVNHARLRAVTTEHPVDLSKTLHHLTQDSMLESTGGRGAVYHLPGETVPTPDDVFGPSPPFSSPSSPNLTGSSPNLKDERDRDGCLIANQLALPIIDDLKALSHALRGHLERLAAEPRMKGKVDREILVKVVLQLCAKHFVTLRCLAELANRQPETLRGQYLTQLVRERKLTLAFPTTPTHEQQAYCASSALS